MNDPTPYDAWKAKPGPATLTPLIQSLKPTIQRSLASYGYDKDSNVISAAQIHLSKGLSRFDPEKSNIDTWATNELKRMPRVALRQRHAIPMPERVAADMRDMHAAERELQDKLGRDPTTGELADHTGISVGRIGKIRSSYGVPTLTEGMAQTSEGEEKAVGIANGSREHLVMELVYGELQPLDQQILDYTFGWHGQPKLNKVEIARRLKRSPAGITQHAAVIAHKLETLDLGSVL